MKQLFLIYTFCYCLNATDFKPLLFSGNCLTCHSINKSISAPSIKKVQKVYKNAFPLKKDFTEYMSTWVVHPNKEGSLIDDAINEYELMPELGFDKPTILQISEYIYNMK